MSNIIEVIKGLPRMARVGKTQSYAIMDAESQLNLSFAFEYKQYLSEFGAVSAKGIELTGIISVEFCNVVSVTRQEWKLNPNIPHNMYVVENTYVDGVVIWQDEKGLIYRSTPGSAPEQIASSFAEYIIDRTK